MTSAYILIVMWAGWTSGTAGKAALSVEFANLKSCQIAAEEIKRQKSPDVLICTPKNVNAGN